MGVVALWDFYIACLVCLVGGWLAVDLLLGFDLVCWVWFVLLVACVWFVVFCLICCLLCDFSCLRLIWFVGFWLCVCLV